MMNKNEKFWPFIKKRFEPLWGTRSGKDPSFNMEAIHFQLLPKLQYL